MSEHERATQQAARLVARLQELGLTVAAAESLTGGLVTATLTTVPGSSACVRGGLVTYATDLKASLLGVDADQLAATGPVDPDVALQMASGVARKCGSDIGLATTGVAGPAEQNGVAVGTVFVAFWSSQRPDRVVEHLQLKGSRADIRDQSVVAVLNLAYEQISG